MLSMFHMFLMFQRSQLGLAETPPPSSPPPPTPLHFQNEAAVEDGYSDDSGEEEGDGKNGTGRESDEKGKRDWGVG